MKNSIDSSLVLIRVGFILITFAFPATGFGQAGSQMPPQEAVINATWLAVRDEEMLTRFRTELSEKGHTEDVGEVLDLSSQKICENLHCASTQELRLQALTEWLDANPENRIAARKELNRLNRQNLPLGDQLQIQILSQQVGSLDQKVLNRLHSRVQKLWHEGQLDAKSAYTILSSPQTFTGKRWQRLGAELASKFQSITTATSAERNYELARELLKFNPNVKDYDNGRFVGAPILYMFCRQNEVYPCIMLMRDRAGRLVKDSDGDFWHQPSLGFSGHNKKYNQVGGNTPRGVYRIDGVMPHADQQLSFGKFRRLVLNFVGSSLDEQKMKLLLPPSTQNETWWRETVVARDIGRTALRIHGTGRRADPKTPYYPLRSTSGCISKRENTYAGIDYIDQRLLLDELMIAQGHRAVYENEPKISALLYVINLDDKAAPMTITDLKTAGIL